MRDKEISRQVEQFYSLLKPDITPFENVFFSTEERY